MSGEIISEYRNEDFAYLYSAIVRLKISLIMYNVFAKYMYYIRVMIIFWTLMCVF